MTVHFSQPKPNCSVAQNPLSFLFLRRLSRTDSHRSPAIDSTGYQRFRSIDLTADPCALRSTFLLGRHVGIYHIRISIAVGHFRLGTAGFVHDTYGGDETGLQMESSNRRTNLTSSIAPIVFLRRYLLPKDLSFSSTCLKGSCRFGLDAAINEWIRNELLVPAGRRPRSYNPLSISSNILQQHTIFARGLLVCTPGPVAGQAGLHRSRNFKLTLIP